MSHLDPEVLIVGAGPAGLSLGHRLSARGIRCTLLEKELAGATWKKSPRELKVLSPWWTNTLNLSETFTHNPFSKIDAGEYFQHLRRLSQTSKLDLREGIKVLEIQRNQGGWLLLTNDKRAWSAPSVVLATGYFSRPFIPDEIRSDDSVPTLHAATIDDYDGFASPLVGQEVLIVGKRVTAGQLMMELHERGVNVSLSVRSPLAFRRAGWTAGIRDQLYFLYEALRISIQSELRANSFPEMDGGRPQELIQSGQVPIQPQIEAIESGKVHFEDGTTSAPNLIVFATGYRPAFPKLPVECLIDADTGLPALEGFQIAGAPGLYVLGFDNLRNFRSRYLRGIRADAKLLASRLAAARPSR